MSPSCARRRSHSPTKRSTPFRTRKIATNRNSPNNAAIRFSKTSPTKPAGMVPTMSRSRSLLWGRAGENGVSPRIKSSQVARK